MRGFYADERVDGKIWNKEHLFLKGFTISLSKKKGIYTQFRPYCFSYFKWKEEIESWELKIHLLLR